MKDARRLGSNGPRRAAGPCFRAARRISALRQRLAELDALVVAAGNWAGFPMRVYFAELEMWEAVEGYDCDFTAEQMRENWTFSSDSDSELGDG